MASNPLSCFSSEVLHEQRSRMSRTVPVNLVDGSDRFEHS